MGKKKMNHTEKELIKYMSLFYMTPLEVQAKDIATLLRENTELSVELWDSMNVLELVLTNNNSVDFEPVDTGFKDPSDLAFIKNRKIKTVFAITLNEKDLDAVIPCFTQLVTQYSGFVCADSPDFTPVYAGSSKKQDTSPL